MKDAHRPFTILGPNVGANSGAVQPAVADLQCFGQFMRWVYYLVHLL